MKQCPTCKFRFPDFHSRCDFDNSELSLEPPPQALIKLAPPEPRARTIFPSRSLLTTLAVLTLFLGAVAIGYLKSEDPMIPAVRHQPLVDSHRVSQIATSSQPRRRAESRRPAGIKRFPRTLSTARREVAISRSFADRKMIAESRTPPRLAAPNKDQRKTSREDSPKIAKILKATWNVIKKPFKF